MSFPASLLRHTLVLSLGLLLAACAGQDPSTTSLALVSTGEEPAISASMPPLLAEPDSAAEDETRKLSPRVVPLGEPVPKGGGVRKIGTSYVAAGQTVTPRADPDYDGAGTASWYGEMFHGRKTANGEIYDMTALTAAHPTLPLPSYVKVTHLGNNRSLVVRVNDRGPFKRSRIIDLSRRAAVLLGIRKTGTGPVRVTYLKPAPLNGDESYERTYLAAQSWYEPPTRLGALDAETAPRPSTAASSRAQGVSDG